MIDETDPDASAVQATQSSPWFAKQSSNTQGLSTTADDGLTNQQLNKIALDLGDQSDDVVTALGAVATAINAKPSA